MTEAFQVRSALEGQAAQMLPGATLDAATGDLLIPVEGGRARVATDAIVQEATELPDADQDEAVRTWLLEVVTQLQPAIGAPEVVAPEALRARLMLPTPSDFELDLVAVAVNNCFDLVVVYEDDGQLNYLQPDQVDGLGSLQELLGTALRQTIAEELLDVDVRDHEAGGFQIRMLAKDGCPYVTAALMSLARFMPVPAKDALVIAPRFSAVAFTPMVSRDDVRLAGPLAQIASSLYDGSPDACSDGVYWWHDGDFYALDLDDDGTVVLPAGTEDLLP